MDAADKIGLLWGFGWIADHNFFWTLVICLMITPFVHWLVGFVLEDRFVPMNPREQFLSFFPGDVFLGLSAAILLVQAQSLPAESAWYNSLWFHVFVLIVTVAVAFVATWLEYRSHAYPRRAMLSPTKLYHNFVLYGGYGYVVFTTFVAVLAGVMSWWILLPLVPFLVWMFLLWLDNRDPHTAARKRQTAHVKNWTPIWKSPHRQRGY